MECCTPFSSAVNGISTVPFFPKTPVPSTVRVSSTFVSSAAGAFAATVIDSVVATTSVPLRASTFTVWAFVESRPRRVTVKVVPVPASSFVDVIAFEFGVVVPSALTV